ncbi:MAG TPA: hypothetical protein V6D04_11405, partial [Candidatus Obscuribacterales bacterium]
MNLTQATATPTIDDSAPASFTCSQCPFARLIDPDGNKYCCQVSQTASDVKRGHWEATVSCYEALAAAEAEKVTAETVAPIAKTDTNEPTSIAPATPSTPETATLSAQKTAPLTSPATPVPVTVG